MVFAPGAAIGPNLRLVRLIAKGGMGSIWIAEHLGLKTQVAVKFIDESLDRDPNLLARFEREAAAAAKIRSPHVVQILDHGSIGGRVPYIVMELLEGESLGSRIARLGRLGVEEAAVIISQTCKGLSRVHALSFVHRDIKPDNLFLIDSGGELFVKVLDFGVAKQKADKTLTLTSTGTAVGTPHYMSPEQLLSSRDSTAATDLWAVGVVAYRALTGELPFDGETYGALCAAVSLGSFRAASELRPELPATMDPWFRKALAAEPAHRFASARELADAFVAAAGMAESRLSVPLSLPAQSLNETMMAPMSDGSGETLAAPESPGFPSTGSGLGHPAAGGRLPSGASIAGASIPNRERPRRQNLALFVVGAAAVGGLAFGLVLARARGGSPSSAAGAGVSAAPPPAASLPPAAPAPLPPPTTVAVAPEPVRDLPASPSPHPPPLPASPPSRETPAPQPFHVRPAPATVRAPHVTPAPPGTPSPPPPSAPSIDTDHGF